MHPEQADRDLFAEAAKAVLARRRLPVTTYRLQFGRSFTFADARRIVPYLEMLGVTDVYASPCLKAGHDSSHGYDVCDHHTFNPTLGSEADFDALAAELRRCNLGLIFDVVPNHMGIADAGNTWWMDVLENGPSSPYAPFFDIDWHPLKVGADLENRVLLPILGDPYGKVLEGQELVLSYEDGAFFVSYYDRRLPVAPRSYADILSSKGDELAEALGRDHEHVQELQSIITAISYLPPETETDPEKVAERQREKEVIKRRVAKLATASPAVQAAIEAAVATFNGTRGESRSFDALDHLLNNQSYRLAFWRVAAEEINYRRFFDVNELAAIRMEWPAVFAETHRLVLRLIREGKVTGLRIDHADGLWDPVAYLRQMQRSAWQALIEEWLDQRFGPASAEREATAQALLDRFEVERAGDPDAPVSRPLYVVVEKILGQRESLPESWPVHGTTGYDFANAVNGLFVDPANRKAFTDLYQAFTHTRIHFGNLVNSSKKMIMLVSLASEINELGYQLKRLARKNRWYRDFTLNSLTFAIREIIAALPIYRTYLTALPIECKRASPDPIRPDPIGGGVPLSLPFPPPGGERVIEEHDLAAIEAAVAEAKRRNPRTAGAVFDFIRTVLLQQYPDGATAEDRAEWNSFVMRFQQTTSPVMAKGVEDTAFYVYNRLLSLNEVGGDPEQFGSSPAAFHRQNAERLRRWPAAMLAGSTHDSKRSADVRARLNALSEVPRLWRAALTRWSRHNRAKKTMVDGQMAPDRNDEYLLYQTLLGAWPLEPLDRTAFRAFRQRIDSHMQKAIKEAKVHTSWVNPNRAYDEAVSRFVEGILTGRSGEGFLADFRPFQEFVAFYGMLNALAQTLLQLTAPGVPDIYQGSELWNFSLVDPDNRGPVDYELRTRLLGELIDRIAAVDGPKGREGGGTGRRGDGPNGLTGELLERWTDGRVKLYLVHRTLSQRRLCAEVFVTGGYRSLDISGARRDHVVGYARTSRDVIFLVIVPRLIVSLTRGTMTLPHGAAIWEDTIVTVPNAGAGEIYRNVFTGETLTTVEQDGRIVLPLASVFAAFPVALLRRPAGEAGYGIRTRAPSLEG